MKKIGFFGGATFENVFIRGAMILHTSASKAAFS